MENTYISQLLDGTEQGFYLALDLGGTNFRSVFLVNKTVIRNYICEAGSRTTIRLWL
jgi:hexokinase